MITRGHGKKEQVVNEPAEALKYLSKWRLRLELQLTEELAEAMKHRELVRDR